MTDPGRKSTNARARGRIPSDGEGPTVHATRRELAAIAASLREAQQAAVRRIGKLEAGLRPLIGHREHSLVLNGLVPPRYLAAALVAVETAGGGDCGDLADMGAAIGKLERAASVTEAELYADFEAEQVSRYLRDNPMEAAQFAADEVAHAHSAVVPFPAARESDPARLLEVARNILERGCLLDSARLLGVVAGLHLTATEERAFHRLMGDVRARTEHSRPRRIRRPRVLPSNVLTFRTLEASAHA